MNEECLLPLKRERIKDAKWREKGENKELRKSALAPVREAAKKVLLLVVRPLRGGGHYDRNFVQTFFCFQSIIIHILRSC